MDFTGDGDLWKQKFMQLDTLVYFCLTFTEKKSQKLFEQLIKVLWWYDSPVISQSLVSLLLHSFVCLAVHLLNWFYSVGAAMIIDIHFQ